MELLDRYLQAVRKHLPWQRQDDIIAELRANLESQLEEKEAALGRPLTVAEAEQWIKQLGSPLQTAAGYQPQQYLIGPAIFPIYRKVLRIALTWCAVIYCIASAAALLAKTPHMIDVVQALTNAPFVLLTTATWVTLVFAAMEYAVAHHYVKAPAFFPPAAGWSLSGLPPLDEEAAGGKKPKSYASAVAEVIFGFFFLIWLLLVPANPFLLMGPGAYYLSSLPYRLAPVWVPVYWCLIVLNVMQLAWNAYHLARRTWQGPQRAVTLAFKAVGFTPMILLLTAPDHATILLKNPSADQAAFGASLDAINRGINLGLDVLCVIIAATLVWEIVRFSMEAYRRRVAV